MKITGVVRSAEEITGVKGLKAFEGKINGKDFYYLSDMNYLAGKRIELVPYNGKHAYDYSEIKNSCLQSSWQAGWLEDIRKEVDWSKVPVNAKVKIKTLDKRLHFAKYENCIIYTWEDGQTSWSSPYGRTMLWDMNLYEVELVEE